MMSSFPSIRSSSIHHTDCAVMSVEFLKHVYWNLENETAHLYRQNNYNRLEL